MSSDEEDGKASSVATIAFDPVRDTTVHVHVSMTWYLLTCNMFRTQNDKYLELSAQLEDLKVSATNAKQQRDKDAQKTLSQQIRSLVQGWAIEYKLVLIKKYCRLNND